MGQIVEKDEEFEVEARRINPEEWGVYWPEVSKQLDTIPEHWEVYWTKDYINMSVVSGGWQAWGFGDYREVRLIVLTQLIVYPASRVLQMVLAFGNNLEGMEALVEAVFERFGMEAGCQYCEIVGRAGWEKKFPRFKRVGVVLRCRVPEVGVH